LGTPYFDAQLEDGSRIHAIIPPIAIDGIKVSIRKFTFTKFNIDSLVEGGALTKTMAEFLQICVRSRFNIAICGGTGSGKTTMMNAVLTAVRHGERMVTIEDTPELQLTHPNTARLLTRIANAEAYDLYLRANHVGASTSNPARLASARDFYRRCLEADPQYAPAWARLGRVYRVLAKYGSAGQADAIKLAEEAFHRALEINPDLPIAHNLYTYFELEERGKATEAVVRLLDQVKGGVADPNLFAGLVVACRFCGLLEASLAADRRARRIDPGIQTSVQYTYWVLGDYAQAALHDIEDIQAIRNGALWMMGRESEALAGVRAALAHLPGSVEDRIVEAQLATMEGRGDDCARHILAVIDSGFHDPEGFLLHSRELAYVGQTSQALAMLGRVLQGGYYCPVALTRDPWFDSLWGSREFVRLVREAEAGHARAAEAYLRAGGERILGVGPG
jgi:tetratricopeptide (TPR) repeat protein